MLTVKKFKTGEEIDSKEIKGIGTVIHMNKSVKPVYVIVDENGKATYSVNRLTGKNELRAYAQKNIAQQEADYLNSK